MARLGTYAKVATLGIILGLMSGRKSSEPMLELDAAERGRHAASPAQMTWLGWKDIALRTFRETFDDRLFSVAAGVAFYGLLALVPAITVLVSLYGLFADPARFEADLGLLFAFMPEGAAALVMDQARRLAAQPAATISAGMLANLAIAVWSANSGAKAMFDALNVVYEEEEKRSFFKLNAVSLAVTMLAAFLLVFTLVIVAVVPVLIAWAPLAGSTETVMNLLRWPFVFVVASAIIAVLFWVGPSRRRMRFAWVLPGAILAAVLWAASSALFAFYVGRLGNYQASYGSLATVVVFMTWLWLSVSVILLGAEFNSELEHQTARDTTEGMAKPRGLRGATMADSVGPRVASK